MSDSSSTPASLPTEPVRSRTPSPLVVIALVLAILSALSLITVLVAAAGSHVIWSGFTIFPYIAFPVAFLLMCVELVRGIRRRSAR